jgi:CHAT domain-containing protein/tetratricopeptide (TPR) repeat protein
MSDLEINLELIESLKKEVDHLIRSDARKALEHAEYIFNLAGRSADPLARALGARAKAQALHALGRYGEAIALYRQASAIYRALDKQVEAARVSRALVDALMYQGRYEEALALAEEARETFVTHGEQLLAAQLETNVGNIHQRLDQYRQALACYERAGAVFAASGDLTAQAVIALNLANAHSNLDDFRQAERLYQRAYDLYSAQGMEMAATHAKYSLGYLHFLKGEYHQAMRVLHETRDALARLGDERHVALCELDLAEIYLQLNVLDGAAQMASQARERFQALAIRYESAKALTFLGLAQLRQQKLAEAERSFDQARREFEQEGNEVYLGLLDIYLAELELKRNQPETASSLADGASQVFSRLRLKAKKCYAQLVAARASLLAGKTERARELSERILIDGESLEAPWLDYQLFELLGDLSLGEGDARRAHEHYAQAVLFIEQIRSGIRVDEFRSAFFTDKLRVYEKLIRLCLNHEDEEKRAEAFFYLESCKARTLVDLLANDLEVTPAATGVPTELLDEWRRLREELHWYYNRISQRELASASRRLPEQPSDRSLQEEISARERALAEVARRAQIHDPRFVWLRNISGLTVAELREALSENEAVIEYYFDVDELKIFVIDRQRLRVIDGPANRQRLKALILELKFQLEKFQYGPEYVSTHAERLLAGANDCLRELHGALFEPVAALVANQRLVFIPFDLLHNVPFQALYDGQNYLIEKHEISCAPSARLLTLPSRGTTAPRGPAGRVLIFGAADEVAPKINEEVTAIRALFPHARCFTGAEATAEALIRHLPGSDLAHIACHAAFRRDNPMFSAFKLADAWLNFYDVCSLNLRSAFITLSGCNTGANRIYVGDEIAGLARGFLSAGATSLVVSLWAVNDSATAKLMTAFYRQMLEGLSPQAALRQASLETKRAYPHPYYWSPFLLISRNHNLNPAPPLFGKM